MPDSATVAKSGMSLLALAIGSFAIGTSELATFGVLPDMSADLGVTLASAGTVAAAYALGVVVGAPLLVIALAKIGRRQALLILLGLFVFTHLAMLLSQSLPVLLVLRFASGLPHGAFFGIAAVTAAQLVPPARQGTAVAVVFSGLTTASVVGVAAGTYLGQEFGWRTTYGVVAGLGAIAIVMVVATVPPSGPVSKTTLATEFRTLATRPVISTLAVITVGFAGVFCMITYVAPLTTDIAGLAPSAVPWFLALVGVGFTVGNLAGAHLPERHFTALINGFLVSLAATLFASPLVVDIPWGLALVLFAVGFFSFATETMIQRRLLTQVPQSPTLSSAFNQSAFNLSNALGAGIAAASLGAGLPVASLGIAAGILATGGAVLSIVSSTKSTVTPSAAEVSVGAVK